jgi:hypothetical protein
MINIARQQTQDPKKKYKKGFHQKNNTNQQILFSLRFSRERSSETSSKTDHIGEEERMNSGAVARHPRVATPLSELSEDSPIQKKKSGFTHPFFISLHFFKYFPQITNKKA